jgi:predicted PurR-regulated permease PerM
MDQQPSATDDRTFVRRVLIVLGLVAVVFLAWQLRHVVVMLFGAVVVAAVFRSLADPICRWTRLPSGVTVAIAVALVFGVVGLIGIFFGSAISDQIKMLGSSLPEAWASLEARVGGNDFLRRMLETARDSTTGSVGNFGRIIMSAGNAAADALVVIFGGIFLAAQPRLADQLRPATGRHFRFASILSWSRLPVDP